jgi:arabinofuranosyltransferase
VFFALNCAAQRGVLVDDAWIFYRYASNWAAGFGPVFNPGERVEGYSSLLWTTLLALGARLSWRPESLGPLLGLLFGVLTLILVAALTRSFVPRSSWLPMAVALAASLSTGLAYFAIAGMDTPLFACVVLAAALTAVRWLDGSRSLPLALSLAALVIVRAEGVAYALTLLGVLGIFAVRGGNPSRIRAHRTLVAYVLVVVALQFGGRRLYYGEWISTPALSKAMLEHAIDETRRLSLPYSALVIPALRHGVDYQRRVLVGLIAAVAAVVIATARGRRVPAAAWIGLSLIGVNALLIVLAAGDWMPYQRLGVAVWPLVLLIAGWICVTAAEWLGLTMRSAHGVAVAAVIVLGLLRFEITSFQPDLRSVVAPSEEGGSLLYRQMGELLARSEPAVTVITNIAGKMPYYAGPRTHVIDLMGLTDRWNARHGDRWSLWFGRTDYTHTFAQPFDLVVTSSPLDLIELARVSEARPLGTPPLLFFPAPSWLDSRLYVAADPRHPIADALRQFCACAPATLTLEMAEGFRSGRSDGGSLR